MCCCGMDAAGLQCPMKQLDLSFNRLGDSAARALGTLMATVPLLALELEGNQVGEAPPLLPCCRAWRSATFPKRTACSHLLQQAGCQPEKTYQPYNGYKPRQQLGCCGDHQWLSTLSCGANDWGCVAAAAAADQ